MFQRVKKKKIVILDVLVVSDDFDHATEAMANASEDVALAFHTMVFPIILAKKEFLSKKRAI